MRADALRWLQEVLAYQEVLSQTGTSEAWSSVIETLGPWRTTHDLSAIRDLEWIEGLPQQEHQRLRTLWHRVDEILNGAKSKHLAPLFEESPNDESIASELADVLLEVHRPSWINLIPNELKSDAGATFEMLSDRSVLVSGENVDGDVYFVTSRCSLKSIAGIRIEALPHASLPLYGPGRGVHSKHETGNFVVMLSVHARAFGNEGPMTQIEFSDAWADQSHHGYPINAGGYWNLGAWERGMGQGKSHEAVFEFAKPWKAGEATEILVKMQFQADPPHLTNLGRFRVSLTSDAPKLDRYHSDDGHAKLATAFQAAGDDQSLKELMEHAPKIADSLGDWHSANARWSDAVSCYDRALDSDAADFVLRSKLANALTHLGPTENAVAAWESLLEVTPEDRRYASERSRMLSRAIGATAGVRKFAAKSTRRQPLEDRERASPGNEKRVGTGRC